MVRFREFLSAAGVAVLVVMIGALIGTLDPMGLDAAADRHSAAVVSRITAPFYGRTPFYSNSRPVGRDQITVVEVSDETLRQANIVWPPPRGFYTQMLDVLAPEKGRRPKAIFLDYIFLSDLRDPEGHDRFIAKLAEITAADKWRDQPGCRVTPAAKISCIIAAGGTPVIIGKPFPPDVCAAGQGDDVASLARLDEAAVVVPLGWPGAPDEARPVLSRDYYRAQSGAGGGCPFLNGEPPAEPAPAPDPLADTPPAPPPPVWRGVGEYDLAPAGAMLVALCEGERQARVHGAVTGTAACHAILDDKGALTWTGPDEMSVAWGSIAKPEYLDFRARIYPDDAPERDKDCRKESRWRFIELGWLQASSAIGENQAATQVPCPYHPTLDYGLVRAEVFGGTDLGREIQRDYLQDHIVLVGAAMVASTDWVDSVVHGRLAGVHYHAMMLDNLMEKGANVLSSPDPVFREGVLGALNLDWGEVLEFVAAFLVVLMVEIGRRRLAGRERPDGRGILWIGIIFVWAGIVLTAATLVTISKHWVPVNIIGLFGLTVMDVIASFWSLEGVAWLIGAGIGGRQRFGRGITRFVFWLASGAGFLFSAFRKRLSPPQREGETPASVLPPEEESPNA